MKKILIALLLLASFRTVAQQRELVDQFSTGTYQGKSYVYVGGVTVTSGAPQGFRVSAAEHGPFFIRPAESIKIPKNIPPSSSENFTRVETILVNGITTEDQISGLNNAQRAVGYQYFDGASRTTQTVSVKESPNGFDFVQPVDYDVNGRTPLSYLPYVSTEQNGGIKTSALTNQASFYNGTPGVSNDDRPYTEYQFELSPLSRIKKVYGGGELWKNLTTDKGSEGNLQINLSNTVRKWLINPTTGLPESNAYYNQGQLSCVTSTSEEGVTIKSYTDYHGNQVMMDNNGLQTYYVYDLLGQLKFILPPLLSKDYPTAVSLAQPSQTTLDIFAFQYKYDARQRLSQEKGPGADNDWIYYVYDLWDRMVAKQDGLQRNKSPKEWSFVKYDELNRPIVTGIFKTSFSTHQNVIDAVNGLRFEIENTTTTGYTLTRTFPSSSQSGISAVDLLTITYYDDYSFLDITGWAVKKGQYSPEQGNSFENSLQIMSKPKGMVTGIKIKGPASNVWLPTVSYYDNNYRSILTISQEAFYAKPDGSSSNSNTADRLVNTYDFTGKTTRTFKVTPSVTIEERFEYDDGDRLKKLFHNINGNGEILLASFNYNELGQLIEKNIHSKDGGSTFLQSVDYRYNIRGWLTSINNSQLSNDGVTNNDANDLFGMNMIYNEETVNLNGSNSQPKFDGRITSARWTSKNLKDAPKERAYNYYYDSKARFQESKYAAKSGGSWTDEAGFYNVATSEYDENGNIKKLKRYSKIANAATVIDDLTYGYGSLGGNQLVTVEDAASTSVSKFGYPNATASVSPEMEYDKNGNLKYDLNSQISSVTYNYLNLPEKIIIDVPNTVNDNSIEFTYVGTGYLVKKVYKKGTSIVRTVQYDHGIQYIDGVLSVIFTPEGRATYNQTDGGFEYEYFLKDHLSNTRVVFGFLHGTDVFNATMEPENSTSEESLVTGFRNVSSTRTFTGIVNKTPPTSSVPAPDYTALTKAPDRTIGPAKMIQVSQGDRLNLSADGITVSGTNGNPSVITGIASVVANSFGIVNSGETQGIYNAFQSVLPGYAGSIISGTQVPKAYLCYVIFNSDYTASQFGYHVIDNSAWNQWMALNLDVTVPYNGFIYVYTANESTVSECYFDEVKIVHHKNSYSLQVTEVNDYDPYGVVLEGTKYVDEARILNNYRYQGEFAEHEAWTGWSRFAGRGNYDGRLGRWLSTDPKSDLFTGLSPYNAMMNSSVNYIDPDGECPMCLIIGAGAVGGGIIGAVQAENAGGNWYDGAWRGALIGAASAGLGHFAPAGILPGLGYGAVTGAIIGGAQAAFGHSDIGQGALIGAVTGGISGGLIGYQKARLQRFDSDIWTGRLTKQGRSDYVDYLKNRYSVTNSSRISVNTVFKPKENWKGQTTAVIGGKDATLADAMSTSGNVDARIEVNASKVFRPKSIESTFIHEYTHATDLATGFAHSTYTSFFSTYKDVQTAFRMTVSQFEINARQAQINFGLGIANHRAMVNLWNEVLVEGPKGNWDPWRRALSGQIIK